MVNDQLRAEFEDQLERELIRLDTLDAGTKEKQIQAELLSKLMDSYTRSEDGLSNWYDKQECRRIDEEDKIARRKAEKKKNKKLAKIEEAKTKLTPGKAFLEVLKTALPFIGGIIGTLLCIGASKDELHDTLKFEETGRINSSGGRAHKRPNFWNKH